MPNLRRAIMSRNPIRIYVPTNPDDLPGLLEPLAAVYQKYALNHEYVPANMPVFELCPTIYCSSGKACFDHPPV